MPADLVLIDTCVWVAFFNRPPSDEKRAVDILLDEDHAALIGPILAEVLQGFRHDDRADWVASSLRGLHFLEIHWDDWRAAATLGRRLAVRGQQLPLTDLTAAAIALRTESAVYRTGYWGWILGTFLISLVDRATWERYPMERGTAIVGFAGAITPGTADHRSAPGRLTPFFAPCQSVKPRRPGRRGEVR